LFDYLHDAPQDLRRDFPLGHRDRQRRSDRRVIAPPTRRTYRRFPRRCAATFVGWHDQVPPATSNKRVGGERAYRKAHRGETVELPPSRVYLHEARWLSHDLPRGESRLRDRRARRILRPRSRPRPRPDAGCGGHLSALHRTSIGPWNDPAGQTHLHLQGRELLPWLRARTLTDQEVGELRGKRDIPAGDLEPTTGRCRKDFAARRPADPRLSPRPLRVPAARGERQTVEITAL
jgi:tRNA pseudouridine55 synthase